MRLNASVLAVCHCDAVAKAIAAGLQGFSCKYSYVYTTHKMKVMKPVVPWLASASSSGHVHTAVLGTQLCSPASGIPA